MHSMPHAQLLWQRRRMITPQCNEHEWGEGQHCGGRRDANVIRVRRLHKKTRKEDLRKFAEPFGEIASIHVWYGFGQGIIEMEMEQAASALLAAFQDSTAMVRGKEVSLSLGIAARADQLFRHSPANPVCEYLAVAH